MITVVWKTALLYAFLTLAIRLLGKRQLGELEVSELVTTLMVSELAVAPITNANAPLWLGLLPVLAVVTIETCVSRLMIRFTPFKRVFGGTPSILIKNGKLDAEQIRKSRVGVDEVLSALRQEGYSCVEDVAYAVLEANGKLSVITAAPAAPATAADHGIKKAERGIAHGVIIDGRVNERSLKQAGKDRAWLEGVLRREMIREEDVLLLTVDDADSVRYQMKDEAAK